MLGANGLAMKKAVEAGREAFRAGRKSRKRFASALSPIDGAFFKKAPLAKAKRGELNHPRFNARQTDLPVIARNAATRQFLKAIESEPVDPKPSRASLPAIDARSCTRISAA